MGLYLIFGRFAVKRLVRKHTYYAVTDRRVLALAEWPRAKLESAFIDKLSGVSISGGRDGGSGTVSFDGSTPGVFSLENTGWPSGGWSRGGRTAPRFYDVPDAHRVYDLVQQLQAPTRSNA